VLPTSPVPFVTDMPVRTTKQNPEHKGASLER